MIRFGFIVLTLLSILSNVWTTHWIVKRFYPHTGFKKKKKSLPFRLRECLLYTLRLVTSRFLRAGDEQHKAAAAVSRQEWDKSGYQAVLQPTGGEATLLRSSAAHWASVAGTSPGGNKGGSARGPGAGKGRSALAVLGLCGQRGGRALCPRARRPGSVCARSQGHCAGAGPARSASVQAGRGGAGPGPSCGAGDRAEARAVGARGPRGWSLRGVSDSVRSERASVVSWRDPCDGARRKEAP